MRHYFTLAFLLACTALFAQPVNDNCSGVIDLGVAPACPDSVFFTNVGATPSDIGFGNIPTCFNGGTVQNDVWFAFTTSDTLVDYTITVTGLSDGVTPGLVNPQIALYRGDCEFDGLAELLCASAPNNETIIELDAVGLTPNVTYFIRINDYSASATPNWGTFKLCVGPLSPVNTIDQDGSTACSGELFDSGGPDGDYENNENHVFTICPSEPHNCITFTLEYYNVEVSDFVITDQILFYDGDQPDPNTLISQIGGNSFSDTGGGGVCFEVQASSGCLTVQFISDGNVTFEGFAGSWQCTTAECQPNVPISVQGNITNDQIVDFISTPQTQVTITDINCPAAAYGLFEAGDNTDLGLTRGLLLTSGSLNWAVGPNNNGGGGNLEANNNAPGDPDLDYLSSDGTVSNDACVIEMDVVAATNELAFEYIFGSEEYPEFVNQFNDIFAFLISGPGITGDPNIGNQLNIAVLPDGNNTLVEINSVNNLINWEYYRDNFYGQSTQYDGLTSDYLGVKKSLTARAEVIPCSTYHLKLAIADRGDFVYDSGVFISELRGGTPDLTVKFNSGIDYLIEDCTSIPDEIIIELSSPTDDTITYNIVIGGTAELGVDYELNIPSSVTFFPGQNQFSFPITPLSDLETEPIETIEISLVTDFGCGETVFNTLVIELHDQLQIEILAGQDTAFLCQGASIPLSVSGASSYFWTPVSIFDNATSATPNATPDMSMWISVQGNVGPCVDTDSIFLEVIDPSILVEALDPVAICQGESVHLVANNNVNNANLVWTPAAGLDDPNSPTPVATPQVTTEYTATVSIAGCEVSDTISIDVSPFDFPLVASDTTICQNYSVQLASFIDTSQTTTTYSWTPVTGLDDPTASGPIATPDATTTYQLIAVSGNGACTDTAEVTLTVIPADVSILNQDTVEICLGESVNLSAVTNTGSAEGLIWAPYDGSLSDSIGLAVVATPELTTLYVATFEVGPCIVFDSVRVRVDSLPDGALTAMPDKDPYCQGEILQFISPTYEPSDFPDIEHQWLGGPGYQSGDTLWNMVLTTQDTFTYQRVSINHACVDTAEISINVVRFDPVFIVPPVSQICPGETVSLTTQYTGQEGEISWQPTTGLSCTDCLDPDATPLQTTVYTITIEVDGCPVSASAQIIVDQAPPLQLNSDNSICTGESLQLNLLADEESSYTWTSPDIPGFSSNDPFLTVSPTTTTTYTVFAENETGCTTQGSITVSVTPVVSMSLPEDFEVKTEDTFTIVPLIDPPGDYAQIFNWTWVSGGATTPELTIQGLTDPTMFQLTYTYGDNCGTIIDSILVTPVNYQVPNAFTPNGDGRNDIFRIAQTGTIVVKEFLVFNRWGQKVFDGRDNEGWDGTHNGKPAPSDVYVYRIVFELAGREYIEQGDVTLLR